jgi:chromosome segregation ATPase
MEIPKQLKDEIWEYCRLNDITDLNAFMLKCLQSGYNIEKYGPTPFNMKTKEPQVIEKEVIKEVEIIKEIPVEKIVEKEVIKEIEIIKEVPVEKLVEVEVIKEVEKIIEKEVFVTDDEVVNKLQQELDDYKATNKNNNEEITILNKQIFDVGEKNKDLNQKITDLNKNILQLNSELTELGGKTTELETKYEEEKKKTKELENSDQGIIKKLNQKIQNLEIELELEKNRHYQAPEKEKPKYDKPKRGGLGNIISWVSKTERDEEDLYGEN